MFQTIFKDRKDLIKVMRVWRGREQCIISNLFNKEITKKIYSQKSFPFSQDSSMYKGFFGIWEFGITP